MKKRIKIVPAWDMLIGVSVGILLDLSILVFMYVRYFTGQEDFFWYSHVILVFWGGIVPIFLIVGLSNRWLMAVELSEKGAQRLPLGFIRGRKIKWSEVYEIRCGHFMGEWMFISKISLQGQNYYDIVKNKNVIQIRLSKKVCEFIKQYYDKEIIGWSEDGE